MLGTWVPLEAGEALAHRNGVYDKLATIFTFVPGNESPPPAPKHTTNKPKLPKKPAVPKFHSSESHANVSMIAANRPEPGFSAAKRMDDDYDNISQQLNDDETPDNMTVDSASFMGDPDDDGSHYDMSQPNTGHRKRKRDDRPPPSLTEQNHTAYADELLDYFMISQRSSEPSMSVTRPEPPPNFQPDWKIDQEGHTAMHWACAMGDIEVMKQLKRFNADPLARNIRGETPLIRAVLFTNCHEKQTFPKVVSELFGTLEAQDVFQSTVLHHCAAITNSRIKLQCARYYLDVLLNKLSETKEPEEVQRILDLQDCDGNTAVHIAAKNRSRKCIRALIGRGASIHIPNGENITAEELIRELNNEGRFAGRGLQSSSPFAPESAHRGHLGGFLEPPNAPPHQSSGGHLQFGEIDQALQSAPLSQSQANNGFSNSQISLSGSTSKPPHHSHHHISEAATSITSTITPLLLSKFTALAASFDEELGERDSSEREARRILNSTHLELASIREQILDLGAEDDSGDVIEREASEFEALRSELRELVRLRYDLSSSHQQQGPNGHGLGFEGQNGGDGQGLGEQEKLQLVLQLREELKRREELIEEYVNATSAAGMGEKGELYRRVVTMCLGLGEEEVDREIDGLVGVLEEERMDGVGAMGGGQELGLGGRGHGLGEGMRVEGRLDGREDVVMG
jgi:transcription factor MBP1